MEKAEERKRERKSGGRSFNVNRGLFDNSSMPSRKLERELLMYLLSYLFNPVQICLATFAPIFIFFDLVKYLSSLRKSFYVPGKRLYFID